MCMEDVRNARETSPALTEFTLASGSWQMILEQDPNRFSVKIAYSHSSVVMIVASPTPPTGALTSGGNTLYDQTWDLQHHGTLVTTRWWARTNALTAAIFISTTNLSKQ